MNFTIKTLRASVIVVAAAGVGLGSFAAPAQAQTRAPGAVGVSSDLLTGGGVLSGSLLRPDGITPPPCDVIDQDGQNLNLCGPGTWYLIGYGTPDYKAPITKLGAPLDYRVWFHEYANGTGWSQCFSGGHDYIITGQLEHPQNILVSENTAPC